MGGLFRTVGDISAKMEKNQSLGLIEMKGTVPGRQNAGWITPAKEDAERQSN